MCISRIEMYERRVKRFHARRRHGLASNERRRWRNATLTLTRRIHRQMYHCLCRAGQHRRLANCNHTRYILGTGRIELTIADILCTFHRVSSRTCHSINHGGVRSLRHCKPTRGGPLNWMNGEKGAIKRTLRRRPTRKEPRGIARGFSQWEIAG